MESQACCLACQRQSPNPASPIPYRLPMLPVSTSLARCGEKSRLEHCPAPCRRPIGVPHRHDGVIEPVGHIFKSQTGPSLAFEDLCKHATGAEEAKSAVM